jgi:hypothetical protein
VRHTFPPRCCPAFLISPHRCVCDVGFVGSDCGIPCPGYAVDALGTASVCTKNGLCLLDGSCLCNSGYSGVSCNTSCPSIASDSTPCSNLGLCVDGACKCFPGFTGVSCALECKGGSENPCSLNGDCQLDGSCVCFPGFRGEACSVECPGGSKNPCNGNGVCTADGVCDCFHGYRQSDCSKKCPGGLEGFLDGNQVVVRECFGELGPACVPFFFLIFTTLFRHQGNGKCKDDGKCECNSGYGRLDCSLEPPNLLPLIIAGGVLGFIIITTASVRSPLICLARSCRVLILTLDAGALRACQTAHGVDRARAQAQVPRCLNRLRCGFDLFYRKVTLSRAFAECDSEETPTAAAAARRRTGTRARCAPLLRSRRKKARKMCDVCNCVGWNHAGDSKCKWQVRAVASKYVEVAPLGY